MIMHLPYDFFIHHHRTYCGTYPTLSHDTSRFDPTSLTFPRRVALKIHPVPSGHGLKNAAVESIPAILI